MKAIVTGSFDPFTLGHLELVKYASSKYDIVYVVALNNADKNYMFSSEERKHIISLSISDIENAVADAYEGFTADYMNEHGLEYENEHCKKIHAVWFPDVPLYKSDCRSNREGNPINQA